MPGWLARTQSFIDNLSTATRSMNKGAGSADKLIPELRGHKETERSKEKETDASLLHLFCPLASGPVAVAPRMMNLHQHPHRRQCALIISAPCEENPALHQLLTQ